MTSLGLVSAIIVSAIVAPNANTLALIGLVPAILALLAMSRSRS